MDGIEALKHYLSDKGPSQADLARAVACSESHLSLVLARKRGLSAALARRISDKTGVAMRDLCPDLAELMSEAGQ